MYIVSSVLAYVILSMNEGLYLLLVFLQAPNDDRAGLFAAFGFTIAVGIIIAYPVVDSNKKAKALTEARDAYYLSLARLKADPTNPDQRQTTMGALRREVMRCVGDIQMGDSPLFD